MKKILSILTIFLVSACTQNHGDFTVLSNKIVNLKEFDIEKSQKVKSAHGQDMEHIILLFPTGNPTLSEALNDALSKNDADVMTDVNVQTWFFWIPYIYGNIGWEVTGDAIKTRKN